MIYFNILDNVKINKINDNVYKISVDTNHRGNTFILDMYPVGATESIYRFSGSSITYTAEYYFDTSSTSLMHTQSYNLYMSSSWYTGSTTSSITLNYYNLDYRNSITDSIKTDIINYKPWDPENITFQSTEKEINSGGVIRKDHFYTIINEIETLQENLVNGIYIHTDEITGSINRYILGNNAIGYPSQSGIIEEYYNHGAGMWDTSSRIPVPQMLEKIKNAGVSCLRWPGGTIVHDFYWKTTIGDVSSRSKQKFGLPEFLSVCSASNAIPLITVADYVGTSQDAADLVEYLNGTSGSWANQRVLDGHPNPIGVIYFEYGCENDNSQASSEYATKYLEYRIAMKAKDPNIKLGFVADSSFAYGAKKILPWYREALQVAGDNIDFIIHHCYLPIYTGNDGIPDVNTLFKLSFIADDQVKNFYNYLNDVTYEVIGRTLPIAVTEYNGLFVQNTPYPYRHTFGNALLNSLFLMSFINEPNVFMANSWQFCNEYWGAVSGYIYKGQTLTERPLYKIFKLFNENLGEDLLRITTKYDKYYVTGGFAAYPAVGNGQEWEIVSSMNATGSWTLYPTGSDYSHSIDSNGILTVNLYGATNFNYYHAYKTISIDPNYNYFFSGSVKVNLTGSTTPSVGLDMVDSRGYLLATNGSNRIGTLSDWNTCYGEFAPVSGTYQALIRARRYNSGIVSGNFMIKDVNVYKVKKEILPEVKYLSTIATKTDDTVYLLVTNKNLESDITTNIVLRGMNPTNVTSMMITGSLYATNESNPLTIDIISGSSFALTSSQFAFTFPSHSLCALRIT